MLASRIRGSLFGALAGDCLGALFEENVVVHEPSFTDEQSSKAFNSRVIDFVSKFPASDSERNEKRVAFILLSLNIKF